MKPFETQTLIKVPFYDLDPMEIVWHGNYVKYLEVARCELFSALEYTYADMRNDGFAYPIATMDLKFIKSAYFGQELLIKTTIIEIEPCIIIKYAILDKNTGEKLLSAKSMQICVDLNTKNSLYTPPKHLKEKLQYD